MVVEHILIQHLCPPAVQNRQRFLLPADQRCINLTICFFFLIGKCFVIKKPLLCILHFPRRLFGSLHLCHALHRRDIRCFLRHFLYIRRQIFLFCQIFCCSCPLPLQPASPQDTDTQKKQKQEKDPFFPHYVPLLIFTEFRKHEPFISVKHHLDAPRIHKEKQWIVSHIRNFLHI